jgi:hypothetical protein
LPAEQLPELRRALVDTTKLHWINALSCCEESLPQNVLCLEHKTLLEKGTVPGFSYETLVPKCCSLQHLAPSIMRQILNMGIGTGFATRPKKGGLWKLLAGPLFRLLEKKNVEEDEVDRLQYNLKFKDVLESS